MGLKTYIFGLAALGILGAAVAGYLFVQSLVTTIAVLEANQAKFETAIELQQGAIDAQAEALQRAEETRQRAIAALTELNNVRSEIAEDLEGIDDPADWQRRVNCLFESATGRGDPDCSSGNPPTDSSTP